MMSKLRLARTVWDDTLAYLRRCSRGKRECVVVWTGPASDRDLVDAALHPTHTATPLHYDIDGAWLHELHLSNYIAKRTIKAQVHVHAGRAFHSITDDTYPIVNTGGFLSLVLPHFALGPMSRDEMWLAQLSSDGDWHRVSIAEAIEGISP